MRTTLLLVGSLAGTLLAGSTLVMAADAPRGASLPTAPATSAQPRSAPPPRSAGTVSRPLSVMALESRNDEAPQEAGGPARSGGSLFAVQTPPPRSFMQHDLVTIVVSEQSKAKSTAKNKTEKDYELEAEVNEFWNFDFGLLGEDARYSASQLPAVGVEGSKNFEGKGDISRNDDFTAKITAEVVEVRPNGNIVLEAFKEIRTDGETQTIRLTGECRPQDVDATNTVLSHRLANAAIEKSTTGELRDATTKGIIAKILDTIFAF